MKSCLLYGVEKQEHYQMERKWRVERLSQNLCQQLLTKTAPSVQEFQEGGPHRLELRQ